MSIIERVVKESIEGQSPDQAIENLISDFPDELHDSLYKEVESLDDEQARGYLVNKLVARREANTVKAAELLSGDIDLIDTCPQAIQGSIERTRDSDDSVLLGYGNNGELISSLSSDQACYKVLFIERARELGSNIAREAFLQNKAFMLINERDDCAQVPEVICFVDHKEVKAIKMEKIRGCTIRSVLEGANELPREFNINDFFEKLQNTLEIINKSGIHHCDLAGNAGNVMIDEMGNPWLIDFGSAIKSVERSEDGRSYQLSPGARYYRSTDQGAIKDMKNRLNSHMRKLTKDL